MSPHVAEHKGDATKLLGSARSPLWSGQITNCGRVLLPLRNVRLARRHCSAVAILLPAITALREMGNIGRSAVRPGIQRLSRMTQACFGQGKNVTQTRELRREAHCLSNAVEPDAESVWYKIQYRSPRWRHAVAASRISAGRGTDRS